MQGVPIHCQDPHQGEYCSEIQTMHNKHGETVQHSIVMWGSQDSGTLGNQPCMNWKLDRGII